MPRIDLNIICKRCDHALYLHLWRTIKYARSFQVDICKGAEGECRCLGFVISASTSELIGPSMEPPIVVGEEEKVE